MKQLGKEERRRSVWNKGKNERILTLRIIRANSAKDWLRKGGFPTANSYKMHPNAQMSEAIE